MNIEEVLDQQEKEFWESFNKFFKESTLGTLLFRGESKPYDSALTPSLIRKYKKGDFSVGDVSHGHSFKSIESNLLEEFKRHSQKILDSEKIPKNDIEWMILAQHYGMPTRLLDWTTNPMVALYFAIESHPDENGVIYSAIQEIAEYKEAKRISLVDGFMTLEGGKFHPFDFTEIPQFQKMYADRYDMIAPIVFIRPKYTDERYSNQKTVLACPETSEIEFSTVLRDGLTVPVAIKPRLRSYLRKIGIDSSYIYPGLTGVASMVTTQIEDDYKNHITPRAKWIKK